MLDYTEAEDEDQDQNTEEEKKHNAWDEKQHLDVLEHYSGEDIIPKKLKKAEWQFFTKAATNTFLEKEDLMVIDAHFQIFKARNLQSRPSFDISNADIEDLDRIQYHMFINIKRAIGIDKNKINERVLQNMQILQSISTPTTGGNMQKRKKFMGLI